MANVMSGRIEFIGEVQTIPSKKGNQPLIKREFVIRAMRFDPVEGTPELSEYNTPIFEMQGQDKVAMLNAFKVGDVVKVNFVVEGTTYEDENHQIKRFNRVRALSLEKLNIQLPTAAPQGAAPQGNVPQSNQPSAQPSAQSPFPSDGMPRYDEHGNPIF